MKFIAVFTGCSRIYAAFFGRYNVALTYQVCLGGEKKAFKT